MIKLKIEKITEYSYDLIDQNNNKYYSNIEFYDLTEKVQVGDTFYINEIALPTIINQMVSYKLIEDNIKDYLTIPENIIVLILKNKNKYYLKRVYG